MHKKKIVLGVLSVVVSACLVAWLLSRLEWIKVRQLMDRAELKWLIPAFIATCSIPFFCVIRWLGVMRGKGIRLPFAVALRAVLMANVVNSFVPSKAGDVVKAAYLKKHGGISLGIGTVILERLVDLAVLGSLSVVASLMSGVSWGLIGGVVILVGVIAGMGGAVCLPVAKIPLPEKAKRVTTELTSVFREWIQHPHAIAQTLAGSVLVWSMAGITVCFLVKAFAVPVSWMRAFAVFPLCILAGLVPVTVSGIGTRDAAFAQFLMMYGARVEGATLVGLGYTLCAYWILSLISLPAVLWNLHAILKRPDATPDKPESPTDEA
jgi:uncharacterized membrane protein YbhN (UPF0104 family)